MSIKNPEQLVALIAEDKMAMRKILKTMLQQMGFKLILEAGDGLEALTILKKRNKKASKSGFIGDNSSSRPVDFIISDWGMPNMTGLEFLKCVRQDQALNTIPFIMLTGEIERQSIMDAVESGVSDYVTKPFTAANLESKLNVTLSALSQTNKNPV